MSVCAHVSVCLCCVCVVFVSSLSRVCFRVVLSCLCLCGVCVMSGVCVFVVHVSSLCRVCVAFVSHLCRVLCRVCLAFVSCLSRVCVVSVWFLCRGCVYVVSVSCLRRVCVCACVLCAQDATVMLHARRCGWMDAHGMGLAMLAAAKEGRGGRATAPFAAERGRGEGHEGRRACSGEHPSVGEVGRPSP